MHKEGEEGHTLERTLFFTEAGGLMGSSLKTFI